MVTPELTLANIRALFNPANYDIILRTLTMAVAVTIASAILAFPMAWYMARYTSGKMKAFFYIAVMLPMWASSSGGLPGRYCWQKMAWLSDITTSGAGTTADSVPYITCGGRQYAVNFLGWGAFSCSLYIWLPFMILPVPA